MSASLAPECNQVKEKYGTHLDIPSDVTMSDITNTWPDSCFLKWYSEKYLRGSGTTDECEGLFKEYRKCLTGALKERGIDKMLEDAREDHGGNDAVHLKR